MEMSRVRGIFEMLKLTNSKDGIQRVTVNLDIRLSIEQISTLIFTDELQDEEFERPKNKHQLLEFLQDSIRHLFLDGYEANYEYFSLEDRKNKHNDIFEEIENRVRRIIK
jgi:hypothetical protein